MKKFLVFVLIYIAVILASPTSAHETYHPFLRINETLVHHNPISSKSIENFELTHEVSSESYLVLQPITFRIDTYQLDKPVDWIKNAKFIFDFGDGEKLAGTQATHTYQKIGTYTVSVFGQYNEVTPQLISHVMIQVIPLKNYRLPKPVISVNNQQPPDQSKLIIQTKFDQEIRIDSGSSEVGSSKIVDYQWDLGDGVFSNQPELSHQYDPNHYNAYVILRLKDENGLYTDSFVELINRDRVAISQNQKTFSLINYKYQIISGGLVFGLIIYILRILWIFRRKKHASEV